MNLHEKAPATSNLLSLESIGFEGTSLEALRKAARTPVGLVLVAGTAGAGKTKTIQSLIGEFTANAVDTPKVVEIEDSHREFFIEGSGVIPVIGYKEDAFKIAMRAAMWRDPDVVYFNEIRDDRSAEIGFRMAQSGVKVFTTIHASSALDISKRLTALGTTPDVLFSKHTISALVYQALLPVVCRECSFDFNAYKATDLKSHEVEQIARIEKYISKDLIAGLRFRNEGGCPCCLHGATGRTAAAEVVIPDDQMLQMLKQGDDAGAFAHWRREGGRLALEHGVSKALRGICDLRDVEHRLDTLDLLQELAAADGRDGAVLIETDPFE